MRTVEARPQIFHARLRITFNRTKLPIAYMDCLHIIDASPPPQCNGKILLWNRFSENDSIDSILDQQEAFFDETRAEFLCFIHKFGEYSINGRPLRDCLRLPKGFSLWWLTRFFERHPAFFGANLFEIFKLRALERLLHSMQPHSVCLHTTNMQLVRTVCDLCKNQNIPFEHCDPAQANPKDAQQAGHSAACNANPTAAATPCASPFLGKLIRLRRCAMVNRAANALAITRYAWRWWRDVRRQFPAVPAVARRSGLLLGTWFPNVDANEAKQGRFRSKYWENVHDILAECGKPVHWFFIHGDPASKAAENIRLRTAFLQNEPDTVDMTFLEECITPWGALRAWLSAMFVAWKARGILQHLPSVMRWPNSNLNVYPLLAGIWKDSTQGDHLMRMCFFLEGIRRYCALIGPQQAVITSSELQFWERLLFLEQRNLGCKRIYAAQHSVIRDADFRFFVAPDTWSIAEFRKMMPDTFFCNGKKAYDSMHKSGFPPDRLGLLEATRFMHLTMPECTQPSPPQRLLVVTSYFSSPAERTLKILGEALRIAKHENQHAINALLRNVTIKGHPYLPVENLLPMFFDSPPPTVQGAIETHLTPGTVVFADSATSVGLLALCRGLPLIECTPEDDFDMGITHGLVGRQQVKNARELLHALMLLATMAQTPHLPLADIFCIDAGLPRWQNLLKNG